MNLGFYVISVTSGLSVGLASQVHLTPKFVLLTTLLKAA